MLDDAYPATREPIPKAHDPETDVAVRGANLLGINTQHAFVHAASCPRLAEWSNEVGMTVVQIGVSTDPLGCIAAMRAAGHGALSCFTKLYDEEFADGDWHLVSLRARHGSGTLPDGCSCWGGAIRVTLPAGTTAADLGKRLSMLLRPLDALRCAQLPEAVQRREVTGRFLPALPRYTVRNGAAELVEDLYRLEDDADLSFAIGALEGALCMLGVGRHLFDRVVDAYYGVAPETASLAGLSVTGVDVDAL